MLLTANGYQLIASYAIVQSNSGDMLMLISKHLKELSILLVFLVTLLVPAVALAAVDPCNTGQAQPAPTDIQNCLRANPIVRDLNLIVNLLGGLVGVVVIGTIIVGGIQYISAGDNATLITAAKQRVMNGVIALVIFIFSYAFLQWLIPGGIFK